MIGSRMNVEMSSRRSTAKENQDQMAHERPVESLYILACLER